MASKGDLVFLLLKIILLSTTTVKGLTEGKAKPAGYISFPPSTYDERSYEVSHPLGNCTLRTERVGNRNEDVVICPHGELLLDGITQANFEDGVTESDIQTFYTWEDRSIPTNEAFITLQFPNKAITPTRVAVFCLELQDLRARRPRRIELYSSTTDSVYPDDVIQDVDDNDFEVIRSGRTSQNDNYEYRRYDLTIRENRQVPLNYLRISLFFQGMNWIFISEVEVYHLFEPLPSTTLFIMTSSSVTSSYMTSSYMTSSSVTSSSITMTTKSSSVATKISTSSTATTITSSVLKSMPTPLPVPTFIFPIANPHVLHLNTLAMDVPINCTITWEGDLSQLTTTWSYNGTMITNSQKYLITEGNLVIRQFMAQDIGTYECTVKHSSGWNDSRQYFININEDANTIKQSGREETSSKGLPIAVIIAAVVGVLALLICLGITICFIICYRKRKQEKDTQKFMHSASGKPVSFLHPYDCVGDGIPPDEERKRSIDNVYEQMNTSVSLTNGENMKPARSNNLPRLPKTFGQPKIPKLPAPNLPKLQDNKYAYLGDYIIMSAASNSDSLCHNDNRETYLDIYDDTVISGTLKSIPQSSPQDIYCEALDCSFSESVYNDMDDDTNVLNMCVPIYDNPSCLTQSEAPKYVEWDNVVVMGKIGEGQFGDVYLAETSDTNTDDLGDKQPQSLVAIKTLKGHYSPFLKQQFEKEIKFMSRLDNANVVRLLGICNKGTPFMMMEYMSNGDLHMFLRKHYFPDIGKDTAEALIPIDSIILQYVALQIANGMRYLASFGFIHRDLAARNCLVGEDYIVKIADFGMTQDLYNKAYFLMQGKALLPIRWMAPESFYGRFSTKTDVWSYGVVLWEIFTLCRKQPYDEITDEELIIDVQKGHKKTTMLKRPPFIPDKVHNVMTSCWKYNPIQRPDFETLYNQLFDYYMQHSQK